MPRKVKESLQSKKGGKVQKKSAKKKITTKRHGIDKSIEDDELIVDLSEAFFEHMNDSVKLVNRVTSISKRNDELSLITVGLTEAIKDLQWRVEVIGGVIGFKFVDDDELSEENSSALTNEEIREILKETEEESGGNE